MSMRVITKKSSNEIFNLDLFLNSNRLLSKDEKLDFSISFNVTISDSGGFIQSVNETLRRKQADVQYKFVVSVIKMWKVVSTDRAAQTQLKQVLGNNISVLFSKKLFFILYQHNQSGYKLRGYAIGCNEELDLKKSNFLFTIKSDKSENIYLAIDKITQLLPEFSYEKLGEI